MKNNENNTKPSATRSPFGGRGACIYIAGKVTGEDKLECAAKFSKAQKELNRYGFQVINPLEVVGNWNTPWETAMKLCIKTLMECDAVFLLPCAVNSKGAQIEVELAAKLGIPVSTQIASLRHFGRPSQISNLESQV